MDAVRAQQLKDRLVHVRIAVVKTSELPYRVERKRNGTLEGMYATREEAEARILLFDLDKLAAKPSRKTPGRNGPKSNAYKVPRYNDYR